MYFFSKKLKVHDELRSTFAVVTLELNNQHSMNTNIDKQKDEKMNRLKDEWMYEQMEYNL